MMNIVNAAPRSDYLNEVFDNVEVERHHRLPDRYKDISKWLENVDVRKHQAVYLIAMLRAPFAYRDRIASYPKVFRRVYAELLSRDRNVMEDLSGLPIDWYVGNTEKLYTYSARAECRRDVVEFLSKNVRVKNITIREADTEYRSPDVVLQFQSPLRIEAIRAILDTIEDTHVFAETLRRGYLKDNPLTRVDYEA